MGNYLVYKHILPNNKIYIGITCNKAETRWNKGLGYKKQDYFYKAILKRTLFIAEKIRRIRCIGFSPHRRIILSSIAKLRDG